MNNVVDLRPFEVVGIVINHMLYNFISHSFANTYIQNLSQSVLLSLCMSTSSE